MPKRPETKKAPNLGERQLLELPGIGKVLCGQLRRVGIETPEELKRVGSREAWLRIQREDSSACYNRLGALEGAIRGVPRKNLPREEKDALKEFYNDHKLS